MTNESDSTVVVTVVAGQVFVDTMDVDCGGGSHCTNGNGGVYVGGLPPRGGYWGVVRRQIARNV